MLLNGSQVALSTAATDAFPYGPTMAGQPTGVPSAFTGNAAYTFDTTNKVVWWNDGNNWLPMGGRLPIVTKSANYTLTASDCVVLVTAGASGNTQTLPPASNAGQVVYILRVDSGAGTVTISRSGSDTIEGATSLTMAQQYQGYGLVADGGSGWHRIFVRKNADTAP